MPLHPSKEYDLASSSNIFVRKHTFQDIFSIYILCRYIEVLAEST